MTHARIQTIAGRDGHTGILRYELAADRGWDVRAELDDRLVVLRHCPEWHGVERLYAWLRRQLQ